MAIHLELSRLMQQVLHNSVTISAQTPLEIIHLLIRGTGGGVGSFLYDTGGERAQVLTGDNIGLEFSRTLPP